MTILPRFSSAIAIAAVLAAALSIGSAPASERTGAGSGTAGAVAPAMEPETAIAALRAAGYAQIRKLEWERGAWEARASDAQGRRFRLCVDAKSAAVAPCRK